MMIEVTK